MFASMQEHGGISCSAVQGRVRLGTEASGLDATYTNFYIKFTSGNCTWRWTMIENFVGPGLIAKITSTSTNANAVYLLATFNQSDHSYNDWVICVIAGTSAGECRTVSAFVTTGNFVANITVVPALSAALDLTSVIKIIGESKCAVLQSPWVDGYGGTCTVLADDQYTLTGAISQKSARY